MFRRLLDRAAPARPVAPDSPRSNPDAGYDAVPRFDRLARALAAAVRTPPAPPRWREGKLFFFDRRRQAELEAARPAHVAAEPFPELAALVTAELPALFASSELRHVARAVPGLRSAAAALAPRCAAARDLAELLAVPDDEAFVVLHPGRRVGCRVAVRGVADVGRFHVLLAAAAPELAAAGAGFQMYTPAALRPDGSLPDGFGGSDHWLWPHAPLAVVPRVGGERVVLLGASAFRQAGDVPRRFPDVPADVRRVEALDPFRTAAYLGKLVGRLVEPAPAVVPRPTAARAA